MLFTASEADAKQSNVKTTQHNPMALAPSSWEKVHVSLS